VPGFWVKEKSSKKSDREPSERFDLELLAIGKRSGLSFAEINELRIQDLLDYVGCYTGVKDEKPRKANQKDIDKFFAN